MRGSIKPFLLSIFILIIALTGGLVFGFFISTFSLFSEPSGGLTTTNRIGSIFTIIFTIVLYIVLIRKFLPKKIISSEQNLLKSATPYLIPMLAVTLFIVTAIIIRSYYNRTSHLTNVSGQESVTLFNKNSHIYFVISSDSKAYKLVSRSYKNARDEVLESKYIDTQSNLEFTINEFQTSVINSQACTSAGTNRCTPFDTKKGKLECFERSFENSCQIFLEKGYVITITSDKYPVSNMKNVIDVLVGLSTNKIQLSS